MRIPDALSWNSLVAFWIYSNATKPNFWRTLQARTLVKRRASSPASSPTSQTITGISERNALLSHFRRYRIVLNLWDFQIYILISFLTSSALFRPFLNLGTQREVHSIYFRPVNFAKLVSVTWLTSFALHQRCGPLISWTTVCFASSN